MKSGFKTENFAFTRRQSNSVKKNSSGTTYCIIDKLISTNLVNPAAAPGKVPYPLIPLIIETPPGAYLHVQAESINQILLIQSIKISLPDAAVENWSS